jgi:hypothetical protein
LCLLVSGCGGFQSETYDVPGKLAAELRKQWDGDLEQMRVALEKEWGVTVSTLREDGKKLRADLPPLVLDVASVVATKTIEGASKSQDPISLIVAAIASAAAGAGVVTARNKVRKTQKKVQ